MAANMEFELVKELNGVRGFTNLFHKENRAWWGTRRWWINALLWPVLMCGLLANMLFVPTIANLATEAEIAQAGGLTSHILLMGLSVFFEFGTTVLALGAIVLTQDAIISEKQSGVAEWLLSKPIARRSYILAKLAANTLPMLVLMVGLPTAIGYGMLSLRGGEPFPVIPFLSGVGIMIAHAFFYLTLTLMLGTIFDNRGPILGIALGSVLGGNLLGGLFKPLLYVTPWMLPKVASLTASSQALPPEIGLAPLAATALWCVVFTIIAMAKFEKAEF
jgi:ABC-type transport system involved in multi-copper enzyme maturation permease subunit